MTQMWLGAVLGALAYYLLGAAWFTPLFGRAWDRSIGYDRTSADGSFPTSYYVVPLLGACVAAAVVAATAHALRADGPLEGAALGAGVGLVAAAASVTNALTPHTPHPYVYAAVTGGYHLVGCAITGILIGSIG